MTPLEKFDRAAARYLEDAKFANKSACTLRNYAGRIGFFRDFWVTRQGGDPKKDPTSDDVRAWVHSLTIDRSPSTVAQYVVELRQFFAYCCDESISGEKFYNANPVYKRLTPKVPKKPYDDLLTPDQIATIYEWQPSKAKDFQIRAVIWTMIDTGIRTEELLSLTEADVDFANSEIVIRSGKGDKFRTVDMHPSTAAAIKAYLRTGIRPKAAKKGDVLFSPFEGGKIYKSSQSWLSPAISGRILGLTGEENVRAHDLRHISARMALCSGMSLERLQGKLGHASIVTTQMYSGALTATRQMMQMGVAFDAQNAAAERIRNEKVRKMQRAVTG